MVAVLETSLVLEDLEIPGYQRVVKVTDEAAGLQAIICIHSTSLGKAALGGTRIYPYATFDDALRDVLRLSKGMTYKSAVSGSGWGGGKSVIIAPNQGKKPEKLLHAFAEAVNQLEGLYICAEDLGCTQDDLRVIATKTPYVVGIPNEKSSANPSPFTAWGVFRGIQAACKAAFGSDSVEGKTVAVQGLGSVGRPIVELLFWHGAKLIISDIDMEKAAQIAKHYGAKLVAPDEILSQPCDILAPCAMGGIINPKTLPNLKCRVVAGAANNQLLTEEDGEELMRQNILYAPDYLINSGGLINVTDETNEDGYHPSRARNKIDGIYGQLIFIFDIAAKNHISPSKAALQLCDYRLKYQIGRRVDSIYLHHANYVY